MGNINEQLNSNNYTDILDALPIATACMDYDNNVKYINNKAVLLFGYSIEDVPTLYDWFFNAFPAKAYRDKIITDFQKEYDDYVIHKIKPKPYNTIITCKNGAKINIEIHTELLPEFSIYSFIDVTEQMKHEGELIKHKQFLERAQQISRIGYWELNLNTKKVWASSQARDIYGFSVDKELIFDDIKNIVLPEYRNLLDKKLDTLIYEDESYNISFKIARKNDNAIIDIHSVAEYNKADNKIFGVLRDITRRKKDERELIEKQERIFEILNSSPSAIACFDNELNLVFFNKKCTELLGYSNTEVDTIYDWFNLAYPNVEYRDKVIKNWKKSIEREINDSKEIIPLEAYVTCKEGNVRYIQFNTKLFSDLTLISMVDMTENKKAMTVIAQSEKKYRSLFENMPEAFAHCQMIYENDEAVDYIHLDVNSNFEKVTGLKNAVGKKVTELLPGIKQSDNDLFAIYNEVALSGKSKRFEFYVNTMNKWFDISVYSPEKEHFVVVFNEITSRKKDEIVLKESETKYRSLFENSTDAICVIKNNRYELVNPSYLTMFGYQNNSELIDMDPNHLVAEDYRHVVEGFTDKRIKGEDVPIYYETKGNKKDGTIFDISVKVSSYTMNNEQYMLVIIRDITDRIIDKEELIIAKVKAEDADRLKSAFLANMSHEIRTPLNAIMGFSQMICDSDIDADQMKEFTEIIRKRSEDLLEIINDILDISRLESGQIILYPTKDNLFNIFNEITNLFKSEILLDINNIAVRTNYTLYENQSSINTDFGRLKQILINLISNAIKFTKEGVIEIGCELADEKTLLFYVKDTGIGIPKNKLDVIFDRFIQADNSTTKLYGGTGLGLSICKSLLELFNGDIWVESEVNVGSTFYFTIPYEPTHKRETKQEVVSKKNYDWSNKTLLIIEDDPYNAIYIKDVLSSTKAKIFQAENAKVALDIFKQNTNIDIVLMDILLPDDTGYNLTKVFLKLKTEQIIIAQTAFATGDDHRRCLSAGCKDFISKPINKKELLALLDKYLSKL